MRVPLASISHALADYRGWRVTDGLLVANRDTPAAFSESSRYRGSETTPCEQRIDACAFVFSCGVTTADCAGGPDDAAVATVLIRQTAARRMHR